MNLFKNEKLDTVNERLTKLKAKRVEIQKSIEEMESALEQTVELFATGKVSEKDIEEAHECLKERRQELADVEQMIAKVESVKKKIAVETIPLVREWRKKRMNFVQKEVDKAVKEAQEARKNYVQKMAAVNKAWCKTDPITSEYNRLMRELGGREDFYSDVNLPQIYPETIIKGEFAWKADEPNAIGITKETQTAIVKKGIIPLWAKDDK